MSDSTQRPDGRRAPKEHLELMRAAMEREAEGQRLLLAGDAAGGRRAMRQAAERYRASWTHAPERAFGRLVGMVKAAIIAGEATDEAAFASGEIDADDAGSPSSWYVLALAALVEGDDEMALRGAEAMRDGGEAFARAADAIAALAARDDEAYAPALRAIVTDFEQRTEHLTGVAFADTALMLDLLAEARGMAVRPGSEVLPPG